MYEMGLSENDLFLCFHGNTSERNNNSSLNVILDTTPIQYTPKIECVAKVNHINNRDTFLRSMREKWVNYPEIHGFIIDNDFCKLFLHEKEMYEKIVLIQKRLAKIEVELFAEVFRLEDNSVKFTDLPVEAIKECNYFNQVDVILFNALTDLKKLLGGISAPKTGYSMFFKVTVTIAVVGIALSLAFMCLPVAFPVLFMAGTNGFMILRTAVSIVAIVTTSLAIYEARKKHFDDILQRERCELMNALSMSHEFSNDLRSIMMMELTMNRVELMETNVGRMATNVGRIETNIGRILERHQQQHERYQQEHERIQQENVRTQQENQKLYNNAINIINDISRCLINDPTSVRNRVERVNNSSENLAHNAFEDLVQRVIKLEKKVEEQKNEKESKDIPQQNNASQPTESTTRRQRCYSAQEPTLFHA